MLVRPFYFLSRTVSIFDCHYGSRSTACLVNSLYWIVYGLVWVAWYFRAIWFPHHRWSGRIPGEQFGVLGDGSRWPDGQIGIDWWGRRVVI